MSKEDGRGLSEEMAAKKREKPQRARQTDVFENLESVILFVWCFLCLFVATTLLPSTFLDQYSSVHSLLVGEFLPEKQSLTRL